VPADEKPARPALVGRERELADITDALEEAAGGRGQLVLVRGAAGIGKTRLVEELAQRSAGAGVTWLRAASEELEKDRPFGVLRVALGLEGAVEDPDRAALVQLLAEAAGEDLLAAGQPTMRFRVVDEVTALVERVSLQSPLALVLEDLHWADASTLVTVYSMARRIRYLPALIVATYRPTPVRPELERLEELAQAENGRLLLLDGLDRTGVETLARSVLGAPADVHLLEHISRTGGNPLFVIELLSALQREGAIQVVDGKARADALDELPLSLVSAIVRRLRSVSPQTIEMLHVAAVLGARFAVADLAELTGRSHGELASQVGEAITGGVLVAEDGLLSFRHDLVRQAVYQDQPRPVRKAMHRRIASVLGRRGAAVGEVAQHMRAGALPGDAEAIAALRKAAKDAAPLDPHAAADLLEAAVGLYPGRDPARDEALVELATTLIWAARPDEAVAIARDVLGRQPRREVEVSLRHALVRALMVIGRVEAAVAEAQEGLAIEDLDGFHRAELLAWRCFGTFPFDPEGARAAGIAAIDLGVSSNNEFAVAVAETGLAGSAHSRGHLEEAARWGASADARTRSSSEPAVRRSIGPIALAMAQIDGDDIEGGIATLARARRSTWMHGSWTQAAWDWGVAMGHFLAGRWDDAIAEAEAGLSFAEESGAGNGMATVLAFLGLIHLWRDDVQQARVLVQGAA